ncbi:hypothetical protein L596_018820 [Steinernema carpocapsae]|uniref:Reelin domain-containing protein n=1 Tax=Steinernema carpocapsae TaxID=34508 RepID=A0A4U5N6W3_STECR|nr:hypothetical protein L596_018820 [Steinernema carpocapsae]
MHTILAIFGVFCILLQRTDAWFGCADDLVPERLSRRTSGNATNPFKIEVRERSSGEESYEYERGTEFKIQIIGAPFSWAEVHARAVLFPHIVLGEFLPPTPIYFHIRECAGRNRSSVVTNAKSKVSRRHGSFFWKAPVSTRVGPIAFVARVLAGHRTFLVQSSILTPSDSNIDDESVCGQQFGCARIGRKSCGFGDSCRILMRWRCFRDSVLVEAAFHGRSASAFGFTTGHNKAAICTAKPSGNEVRLKEYFISPHHGFPITSDNVTFLRGKRDSHSAFCRFEIPRPRDSPPSIIFGSLDIYGNPNHLKRKRLRNKNFCNPSNHPMPSHFLSLASLSSSSSPSTLSRLQMLGFALIPFVPKIF